MIIKERWAKSIYVLIERIIEIGSEVLSGHLLTIVYLTGSLYKASVVALIYVRVPNPNTSMSGVQKNCL